MLPYLSAEFKYSCRVFTVTYFLALKYDNQDDDNINVLWSSLEDYNLKFSTSDNGGK